MSSTAAQRQCGFHLGAARQVLIVVATLGFLGHSFGQSPPSLASRFTGLWKSEESDETVTLSVDPNAADGDAVVITSSDGGLGSATLKGDKIVYNAVVGAQNQILAKVEGAYAVSADGTSLTNHRKIFYHGRTIEDNITYDRVSPIPSLPTSTNPPLMAVAPMEPKNEAPKSTPTPAPKPVESSPFAGSWQPADDSSKLTIGVSGRNAFLKYSPGARDSGTIRGGKIECQTVSRGDGTSSNDVFEMSANGRTLIRRRTFQSPNGGEVGHETLTYNHAE